jgi:hypothetical protein
MAHQDNLDALSALKIRIKSSKSQGQEALLNEAYARIGQTDAIEFLTGRYGKPVSSLKIKMSLIWALEGIREESGHKVVDFLRKQLEETREDELPRVQAALALARIGTPSAKSVLTDLHDTLKSNPIINAANEAGLNRGDPIAEIRLMDTLLANSKQWGRKHGKAFLIGLTHSPLLAEKVFSILSGSDAPADIQRREQLKPLFDRYPITKEGFAKLLRSDGYGLSYIVTKDKDTPDPPRSASDIQRLMEDLRGNDPGKMELAKRQLGALSIQSLDFELPDDLRREVSKYLFSVGRR